MGGGGGEGGARGREYMHTYSWFGALQKSIQCYKATMKTMWNSVAKSCPTLYDLTDYCLPDSLNMAESVITIQMFNSPKVMVFFFFLMIWENQHEFEQTPGDSIGQRLLVCCSLWSLKEWDLIKRLNSNLYIVKRNKKAEIKWFENWE